jgi:hypothetical protein
MEHMRSIVLGVAFPTVDSRRRTRVFAFADKNETGHYLDGFFAAETWGSSPLFEPVIIMAADADENNQRLLTHELTHAITHQFVHRQPGWFAEGIASFFETVSLDAQSADVTVGEPSPDRVRYVQRKDLDPVSTAFACRRHDCMTGSFYATSWAVITYLLNRHPAELARYVAALVQTDKTEWSEIIPELPTAVLQHEISTWLMRGEHSVWRYKLHVQAWPTTTRKLPEADVHAMKAMLLMHLQPEESRTELATALRLDPENLVANLVVAAREHGLPLDAARAFATAHDDDWRAVRLLAIALRAAADPAATDAHARMCELLAVDPHADPPPGLTCSTVARP